MIIPQQTKDYQVGVWQDTRLMRQYLVHKESSAVYLAIGASRKTILKHLSVSFTIIKITFGWNFTCRNSVGHNFVGFRSAESEGQLHVFVILVYL